MNGGSIERELDQAQQSERWLINPSIAGVSSVAAIFVGLNILKLADQEITNGLVRLSTRFAVALLVSSVYPLISIFSVLDESE